MRPNQALDKAVEIMGSQTALARACGVKPQAVQQWVASGMCPLRRAVEIERLTDGEVKREVLRPDIYAEQPIKKSA